MDPKPGHVVVDGTLGGGGHAKALFEYIRPGGMLVGIDRDPSAVDAARRRFAGYGDAASLVSGNYSDTRDILDSLDVAAADGMVLDLGMSQYHVEQSGRGFSFMRDEELDMRMGGPGDGPTAAEVVNTWSERDLARAFARYGEEKQAKRIARRLAEARRTERITTSGRLAELVASAKGWNRKEKIHPATLVFQALRIVVNSELEHLSRFLETFTDCLATGGRLCIISFHSLEDRMVKQAFRNAETDCTCPPGLPVCGCDARAEVRVITKRPVVPSDGEVEQNPQARSAKLRVVEKL